MPCFFQKRLQATRTAIGGATGVRTDEGSFRSVTEDIAAEIAVQILRIRENTDLQVSRLLQGASLTRDAGRNAQTQGFIRGTASLLKGLQITAPDDEVNFRGGVITTSDINFGLRNPSGKFFS